MYYESLYTALPREEDPTVCSKFLNLIPRDAITPAGCVVLGKDITIQELYEALKRMNKGAVPGVDGLTVSFYLHYWDLLKDWLFASYLHAFECGRLSISQRKGLIRLLPKKDRNLTLVSSWRPIALLTVDYKILTKLFSIRLAAFLPKMVHRDQKGFVKGRSIHDNLLDIQALIAVCEDLDEEGMLILLDIQKAFDNLSWKFLASVLIQYNFPDSFIRWFEVFYSGKELHVINNGFISKGFHPQQGLSQGCGISPLFFVLAIEVLALAIRENPKIQGIMLDGSVKKISLLADDRLLALKWAKETLDEVISTLNSFYSISNLKVNPHKSTIIPIGKNIQKRPRLPNLEAFPHSLDGSFKYLGIDGYFLSGFGPASKSRAWDLLFHFELEASKAVIRDRNESYHSLLGRILTVKSLIFSRFVYKIHLSSLPSQGVVAQVSEYLK